MPIQIGDIIDLRLRVVEIRHGFFSNVYVVEEPHPTGPKRVVLKRLRLPFAMRGRNLALFRYEGRVACSLPPSWFLANPLGFRNTDHGEMLLTEFVDGPSAAEWFIANAAKGVSRAPVQATIEALLKDWNGRPDALPICAPTLYFLAINVLAGLLHLHHANVSAHGDLHPGNVLLDVVQPHRWRLIDFGLSRTKDSLFREIVEERVISSTSNKTLTYTPALGRIDYLAPELVAGRVAPNERTDIYAFGRLLADAILTVSSPADDMYVFGSVYSAGSARKTAVPTETIRQRLTNAEHEPNVLARCALRCLAEDPAARFSTPLEVIRFLFASGDPQRYGLRDDGTVPEIGHRKTAASAAIQAVSVADLGDERGGFVRLRQALSQYGRDPQILNNLGLYYLDRGAPRRAATLFCAAAERTGLENALILDNWSLALADLDRVGEAVILRRAALRICGDDRPMRSSILANSLYPLLSLRLNDEAMRNSVECLELRPSPRMTILLAEFLSDVGRYADALGLLSNVTLDMPEAIEGWLSYFRVLRSVEMHWVVRLWMPTAIQIAPHSVPLLHESAIAEAYTTARPEVLEMIAWKIVLIAPTDRRAIAVVRDVALQMRGEAGEAETVLRLDAFGAAVRPEEVASARAMLESSEMPEFIAELDLRALGPDPKQARLAAAYLDVLARMLEVNVAIDVALLRAVLRVDPNVFVATATALRGRLASASTSGQEERDAVQDRMTTYDRLIGIVEKAFNVRA